jgi:CBS domain-containing protein
MIRRDQLEQPPAGEEQTVAQVLAAELHHDPRADDFPHVHPDHGLHLALERIGPSGLSVIPVVSRANVRKLLGVVVLADLLRAYGVPQASRNKGGSEQEA